MSKAVQPQVPAFGKAPPLAERLALDHAELLATRERGQDEAKYFDRQLCELIKYARARAMANIESGERSYWEDVACSLVNTRPLVHAMMSLRDRRASRRRFR
jgi:hypothetical protein